MTGFLLFPSPLAPEHLALDGAQLPSNHLTLPQEYVDI